MNTIPIALLPKAELHVHLEGTIAPSMVRSLASQHNMAVPDGLIADNGEHYLWKDFLSFLRAYDLASSVIKTPADYHAVTYDYLRRSADEGVVYTELMSSADHAYMAGGMDYVTHLEGIIAAIDDARRDCGIEARLLVSCVRHLGPERAVKLAREIVNNIHPYVVGFAMGGDENYLTCTDFLPAYEIIADAGLGANVHAGEIRGADSVIDALQLPITRIGHGVRSVEDKAVLRLLVERDVTLEVCPTSNICLGVFDSYAAHSLPDLLTAGIAVTLNSDDPPFFNTTIGNEYKVAREHFGFNDEMLLSCTRRAIDASFADKALKVQIHARIDKAIKAFV